MIKRFIYLGYYLKEIDKQKFRKFFKYVTHQNKISKIKLLKDILRSSLTYNISLLDYFYFRFYELNQKDRKAYAGTGFMYEYQLKMNPKGTRAILEDKILFLKEYESFVNHEYFNLNDVDRSSIIKKLNANGLEKIVLKSSDGQCGEGVEVIDLLSDKENVLKKILKTKNDLLEEYIFQHDELMKLSPSGLNTVRIFTQLNNINGVDILGCRLRITINSTVDNLAAGNIAASINIETGIVDGTGVYSDITKKEEYKHPVTGVDIVGFQIPYWEASLQMAKDAALLHPENRSVGWDVAITNEGPELLEGNHNWCKLLWQLPVKKGLKPILEKYL